MLISDQTSTMPSSTTTVSVSSPQTYNQAAN
jgi:hypothetical protein